MNLNLKNKNVVVTGGSRGIGFSIVTGFLHEEANVYIVARNIDLPHINQLKLTFPDRLFFYAADITQEAQLQGVYRTILKKTENKIDILVCCVGSGKSSSEPINKKEFWEKSWDLNFVSAVNTARAFVDILDNCNGSIVFISSIAGIEYIGAPTDYSSAKSALISFSKTLSHKLAPNIRVNIVAPGNVWIENGTWDNKMKENREAVVNMLKTKVPLQRFGLPEEIANLVLFISSEKAAFITGSCITIDGGQTITF